ncbi:tetratricopeptide (TPR) repeat protein/transcriptional regulator with XRE-family HTH domain [Kibdelosporangium banguiense]|uniref:Tetratricopeptide (TPR) repeat protein/transcriptional regulator with XRE-family HTH domain n=1 Tax=Kibdelosporangium banguiense TaxID=1365924 RepID=A0ABS4TLB8_9PSEU|nr:helix-turn-helix domain-containing protein [Kibdelosporangium banguiense]MBP2325218.1 tetratricopeptide (TPR) repeat protein/transcriptional regulator with XRE-family HTH domain [Kibdelosporangium banguiense]
MTSAFSRELEHLLAQRDLSWRKLAKLTGYTPGWLSKVKNGAPPSADLARRCDEVLEADGELIALAAVRSLRPAQLPATTASFVGRAGELRALGEALGVDGDPGTLRVVTIEGPPGVGKTALALRLANDIAGRYPDGHLYIDLNGFAGNGIPVSPEQSLEEFLGALGVPADEIAGRLDRKAALFRSVLANRRVLVVLDNALNSKQVEHLLPGGAGCAVIVTSRNRLSGLAVRTNSVRVPLGPLSSVESASLISAVIGGDRAAGQAEALAELARQCAYLPLALRIAAERVNNQPDLPVSALAQELAAESQPLEMLSVDDTVAVMTVFSWSYRSLDEATARMFRLVSLHPGPHVCVAAAAASAGVGTAEANALLKTLAGMHLLDQVSRDRYRTHDLLRLYGLQCGQAEDTDADRLAAVSRLTDWYLHTAVNANETLAPFRLHVLELEPIAARVTPMVFDDPVKAFRWCDAELLNFVPVSRLAADHGLRGTVWRLAVALFDYLLLRKPWGVWTATHELAYDAADDRPAKGWIGTNLAVACRWLRDYDRCERLYTDAMAIRQETGDRHGQAWILEGLAAMAIDRGQMRRADSYAQEALRLFFQLGDVEGQAAALVAMSDVYRESVQLPEALATAEKALRMCEEIDDLYGQGRKLVKVADVYAALGDPAKALEYVEKSLVVRREAVDRWGEADSLTRRGDILNTMDDEDSATDSWNAALALYEQLEDPHAEDIRMRLRGMPGNGSGKA